MFETPATCMSMPASLYAIGTERTRAGPLEGSEPADYGELVRSLGLGSSLQARNALITAKRIFVRILRDVVGEYIVGEDQITGEIEELRRSLLGGGASH